MSRLSTFFKDADTVLGIFYPKHHLLAAFPNLADADRAADRAKVELSNVAHKDEDVISVSGAEVVGFAEDHLLHDGLWGALMTEVSRTLGTEALYADKDLAAARQGTAFVAVHCRTEDVKTAVWKALEPTHPLVARFYGAGGMEHLAGEN